MAGNNSKFSGKNKLKLFVAGVGGVCVGVMVLLAPKDSLHEDFPYYRELAFAAIGIGVLLFLGAFSARARSLVGMIGFLVLAVGSGFVAIYGSDMEAWLRILLGFFSANAAFAALMFGGGILRNEDPFHHDQYGQNGNGSKEDLK